jgi:hypothetical protein
MRVSSLEQFVPGGFYYDQRGKFQLTELITNKEAYRRLGEEIGVFENPYPDSLTEDDLGWWVKSNSASYSLRDYNIVGDYNQEWYVFTTEEEAKAHYKK